MATVIRPMEPGDTAELCQLRLALLPQRAGRAREDTQALFDWLYFSPHLSQDAPRAFVAVDGSSIIGHIGFTMSEWRLGHDRVNVVQPVNWVLDPTYRGLLGLSLIMKVLSGAGVAVTVGGTPIAQRMLPKLGFAERLDVGSYVKVLAPLRFLGTSRTGHQLAKNSAKVAHKLGTDLCRSFRRLGNGARRCQLVEVDDPSTRASDAKLPGTSQAPAVLRNSLAPQFLKWYQACPVGQVRVLQCLVQGQMIGTAVVMLRTTGGTGHASLLTLDTVIDDETVWVDLVEAIEEFAREQGAAYINALATYTPLRRALKHRGYRLLEPMPLWLRDRSHALADVGAWHITAIEGDNGYLLN